MFQLSQDSTHDDWASRYEAHRNSSQCLYTSPFPLSPDRQRLSDATPSINNHHPRRSHATSHFVNVPTLVSLYRDMEDLSREFELFTARSMATSARGYHSAALSNNQRLPNLPETPARCGTTSPISVRRMQSPVVPRELCLSATSKPSPLRPEAIADEPRATPEVPAHPPVVSSPSPSRDGRIRVVVRKRPITSEDFGEDCVHVNPPNVHVAVRKQRVDLTNYKDINDFVFDDAFDENKTNAHLFEACGKDLLTSTMEGGSASCFAYGQTGSGKTHTMIGNDTEKGLYILAAAELFDRITPDHEVYASLYEIYCNSLFDLLNCRAPMVAREDHNRRVNICGLSWHRVNSVMSLWTLIGSGADQRRTGSTSANEQSSRSHAVLTIQVRRVGDPLFCGTLNFVDLAGSERAGDTAQKDKQTRLEGAEINKSLLALKECIRALDEKKRHIPFRGSKLTEILRDSFTANCRTLMIANISATASNYEHTVNTLRYAFRVKGLSVETIGPSRARNAPRAVPRPLCDVPPLPPAECDERPARQKGNARTPSAPVGNQRRPVLSRTPTAKRPMTPRRTETPNDTGTKYLRAIARVKLAALFPRDAKDSKSSNGKELNFWRNAEELVLENVMEQLKRDIGHEIRQILDERDELIAKLRVENGALHERIVSLEANRLETYCPSCGFTLDSNQKGS